MDAKELSPFGRRDLPMAQTDLNHAGSQWQQESKFAPMYRGNVVKWMDKRNMLLPVRVTIRTRLGYALMMPK